MATEQRQKKPTTACIHCNDVMIVAFRRCRTAAVAAVAAVQTRRYAYDKTAMFQRRLRAETVGRRFQLSDDDLRDVVLRMSYVPRAGERAGPLSSPSDCPCAKLLRGFRAAARAVIGLVVDDSICACCYAVGRRAAVVDAEWAACGQRGELDRYRNRYDRSLDARSRDPGRRVFEKLTSGKQKGLSILFLPVGIIKEMRGMVTKTAVLPCLFVSKKYIKSRTISCDNSKGDALCIIQKRVLSMGDEIPCAMNFSHPKTTAREILTP